MLTTIRSNLGALRRLGLLMCVTTGFACNDITTPVNTPSPGPRDRPIQPSVGGGRLVPDSDGTEGTLVRAPIWRRVKA